MHSWYFWFIMMLIILVIIPAARARQHRQVMVSKRNRLKRRKEVIVWAGTSSGVTGTATKIEENWLEVEDKDGNKQILNTDYISRIQEYPRNKNGKKKAVIV